MNPWTGHTIKKFKESVSRRKKWVDLINNPRFLQSLKVFESLGKMICRFQDLESLWKINNSTEVFESLWFTTFPAKMKNHWFPELE